VAVASASIRQADEPAFPGFVRSFAFDAGRTTWIDSAWVLRTRMRSGAETKLLYTDPYKETPENVATSAVFLRQNRLVLERSRLLWWSRRARSGGGDVNEYVYTASVESRKGTKIADYVNNGDQGGFITGLAGDSSGLSYSVVNVNAASPAGGSPYRVTAGGLWSVIGLRRQRVPGVPPGFLMTRAAGRVAIVPAELGDQNAGLPRRTGIVEIRDAASGSLISSISPTLVDAVALSSTTVAVLVGGRVSSRNVAGQPGVAVLAGARIERYDIATGQLTGSTPAPPDTVVDLDMSGNRVALRTTSAIKLLDIRTGHISTIASTSPWRPAGVAISGSTVAWMESKRIAPGEASKKTFQTRIRTLVLS
jgi:hypothetical protein